MSQAKVDRYKEQKKNIKQTVKKEKRNHVLRWTAAIVIAVAAIGWFGFSVYQSQIPEKEINVETDYTAFDTYVNGLGAVTE